MAMGEDMLQTLLAVIYLDLSQKTWIFLRRLREWLLLLFCRQILHLQMPALLTLLLHRVLLHWLRSSSAGRASVPMQYVPFF